MKKVTIAVAVLTILLTGISSDAGSVWDKPTPNIYWGDLHVHTNFSWDAYAFAMAPGIFTDEAGMYGTYCSKLDFFAFTDHAEGLTDPDAWQLSIKSAQRFNELGRSNPDSSGDPKVVAFMGFEWTKSVPYGHKNIIFKHDDEKRITPGPIPCERQVISKSLYWSGFVRNTFPGKKEPTDPSRLYERLDRECLNNGSGCRATVIPHGNAWGNANFRTNWDIQNNPAMNRPDLQRNIEVYSKHGNSEEYRYLPPEYRYYIDGVEISENECLSQKCKKVCQEPTEDYVPCCYRAGEIVKSRCIDPESEFCREQINLAREKMEVFPKGLSRSKRKQLKEEYRKKPSEVDPAQWQACGNCRTCYQPAWNYVPNGSVQKALVTYGEDSNGDPAWFRFGFVGSTDTHQGRPASVKEVKYVNETAHKMGEGKLPVPQSILEKFGVEYVPGQERFVNFFNPGGIVAIQAPHRTNVDLFDNLVARHVYSTSGQRIEAWLRAEVFDGQKKIVTMGDETASNKNPVFHIRANGAFREDETCSYDEEPEIMANFTRDEFLNICYNQCYRVLDERVPIDRIEVVKILQPLTRKEAQIKDFRRGPQNPNGLIIDPYHVQEFDGQPTQVEWSWTDPEFENETPGRSVVYYFRIIQAPTEGYQCNPTAYLEKNKTCNAMVPDPLKVDTMVNPQDGSAPKPRDKIKDTCYTDPADPETYCHERAWTSPVYITRK